MQPHREPTQGSSAAATPPSLGMVDVKRPNTPPGLPDATHTPTRHEWAFAAGELKIRSERRGSDHVVALSGELDLANADSVDAELQAAEATDAGQIILDLGHLDFIDSTGLRLIITANSRSETNGRRLRLLPGPPQVQRIFELTATTDRLPFAGRCVLLGNAGTATLPLAPGGVNATARGQRDEVAVSEGTSGNVD